jgi:hypothetical protein
VSFERHTFFRFLFPVFGPFSLPLLILSFGESGLLRMHEPTAPSAEQATHHTAAVRNR